MTVAIKGGGSGEVSSTANEGFYEGNPPIACAYTSPGPATGTCEDEMSTEEELYGVFLTATPAPGSQFAGWVVEGAAVEAGGCGKAATCFPLNFEGETLVKVTATFKPIVLNPAIATTNPATSVNHTTAVLNGHLDPAGDPEITDCHFDWGTDTSYSGGTVPCKEGNSFTTPADVSADLGNLHPGTTYHFRLSITGPISEVVEGADQSFTATSFPISTKPATNIKHTTAVLNGSFDPQGDPVLNITDCHFDWGTDTSYSGGTVPCKEGNSFTTPADVSADLGNLHPGTTYHFRLHVSTASAGEFTADDQSFTATSFPISTKPATTIHHTSVVLNGSFDPQGDPVLNITDCHFDWGTDTSYSGGTVPCKEGNSFTTPADVSANLGNLTPGLAIHFRLHVTTASAGEFTAGDETVTPPPFPTSAPTQIASFGPDGTSATSFGPDGPLSLAFDDANRRLYAFDGSAPGIYGFDASAPPAFIPVPSFAPRAVTVEIPRTGKIAVDNSGTASAGHLYFTAFRDTHIYGFDSSGAALGGNFPIDLAVNPDFPPTWDPCDVAVDPAGGLWISDLPAEGNGNTPIVRYNSAGAAQSTVFTNEYICNLALDSGSDLYFNAGTNTLIRRTVASEYQSGFVLDFFGRGELTPLAIDHAAADTVYVAHRDRVSVFAHNNAHFYDFDDGVSGGQLMGIAIDPVSHYVYVSDLTDHKVHVFPPGVPQEFPTVTAQGATGIAATSVTLNAKVDPETFAVTDCHFDLVPGSQFAVDGYQSVTPAEQHPCAPSPGSGSGDVAVSVAISGLQVGANYHFRVVAANANGTSNGDDGEFTTHGPAIKGEAATQVTETGATIGGLIDPRGEETSFAVEYVTDAGFLESGFANATSVPVPAKEIGSGTGFLEVTQPLSGLTPDTTYHFRLVATNPSATFQGPGGMFTTFPTTSAGLADGRAYEMVTPPHKLGEPFPPDAAESLGGSRSCGEVSCAPGEGSGPMPIQSAPDGEAIVYQGQPFSGGTASGANEYLARRGLGGWETQSLSPSGFASGFMAFSPDFVRGVFEQDEPVLSPKAPTRGGLGFANLYLRQEGAMQPLVTDEPPNRDPGHQSENRFRIFYEGANSGTASDPAYSHVLFIANDALTAANAFAPAAPEFGPSPCELGQSCNLYEWDEGQLRLLNVLPGNAAVAPDSMIGSRPINNDAPDVDHAISADGSRIFWSEVASGQAYVRIDGKETEKIEDPGRFLTATPDGSKVLLDDGCLYDLGTKACEEDLADGEGGFQGILGGANDLSRVYFVDTKVLSGGEENANGEHAEEGEFNLYAWQEGATAFIGTLLEADNKVIELAGTGANGRFGAWRPPPPRRTAQVSSDGRYLTFMSQAPLTGYENKVKSGGHCQKSATLACFEVFVYDAGTGSLACPSCNPVGQSPLGSANLSLSHPWFTDAGIVVAGPRNLALSGQGRLFFESRDTLSPHDANGRIQDVYEWEPDGVGSCKHAGGCVSLISSGNAVDDSYFVDSSASGRDAFFITREQLVPRDKDEQVDIYDARAGGGIDENTPPPCLGEACKGSITSPPAQQSPGSSSFSGPGNEKPKKHKKHKKRHKHKSHHKRSAKHNRGGSK